MAQLAHPDWFLRFLDVPLGRHEEVAARVAEGLAAAPGQEPRDVAEAWVERSLRERGLSFGAPLPLPDVDPRPEEADEHTRLLLVALRHQAELALELACLYGRDLTDREVRRLELLLLFSVLAGAVAQARDLEVGLTAKRPPNPKKAARALGAHYVSRLEDARGRPPWTLGVTHLHDAAHIGGLALDLHERRLRLDDVQFRLGVMDSAARLALVEVLAGVARADGAVDPSEQRLIEDRIALSAFTRAERRAAHKAVREPRPARELAERIEDASARLFVLEQAVLASHADGYLAVEESSYIADLAVGFGFLPEVVSRVEADIAAFYERHREHLDLAPGAGVMRVLYDRVSERVTRVVKLNAERIVQEVKETGELSVLLVKAGRGDTLTAEEREKVRSQLLDIAKTIPALAVFALPGGGVLLPILIKVLPFNLLPTAFAEEAAPPAATAAPRDAD